MRLRSFNKVLKEMSPYMYIDTTMGYRRYRKYRKTYRKRPRFYRRFKKYSRRTKLGKTVHYFKRTYVHDIELKDAGWKGGTTLGSPIVTKLDDIASYQEFVALYDSYKICGIKKKFVFTKNSADVDGTVANELPQLITVNDFNDKEDLPDEATALQYASYKARRLDKPVSRYYRPHVTLKEGSQAPTFALLTSKSRWLSTVYPTVEHFGMKWGIDTVGTTGAKQLGHLRVYTTLYIACMGQR